MKLKQTLSLWMMAAALATPQLSWAQNKANPMDWVGQKHNAGVECLMKDRSPYDATAFERVVTACGYDPGMPADAFVERSKPMLDQDFQQSIAKHMDAHRGEYTAEEFEYFLKLDAIFESAESPRQAEEALAELEQFRFNYQLS
jgi:hypothetical protein